MDVSVSVAFVCILVFILHNVMHHRIGLMETCTLEETILRYKRLKAREKLKICTFWIRWNDNVGQVFFICFIFISHTEWYCVLLSNHCM